METQSNTEELKNLRKSIVSCYTTHISIHISNKSSSESFSHVNDVLFKLLYQREDLAKKYVETPILNGEQELEILLLFKKINEDICKVLNLNT